MPAQIIQMMAFAQIMDIWRPGRSMEDHLKVQASEKKIFFLEKCLLFFLNWT